MRSFEDPLFKGSVLRIKIMLLQFLKKSPLHILHLIPQLGHYPGVELLAPLCHKFMVDGGFYISYDYPVQKFEQRSLHELFPVNGYLAICLFEFRNNVGYDHLVGLLIKLGKSLLGPDMIIPALHMGCFIDKFKKRLFDHYGLRQNKR